MTNSQPESRIRRAVLAICSNAYILLSFTALIWAGYSIVGRAARDLIPPAPLSFRRWSLTLLPLFAWKRCRTDGQGYGLTATARIATGHNPRNILPSSHIPQAHITVHDGATRHGSVTRYQEPDKDRLAYTASIRAI